MSTLITVKVTAIQGPFARAEAYFLGQTFNVGVVDDRLVKVARVELLGVKP